MKLLNCNPTKFGVFLRLLVALILLVYAVQYENIWVMFLGAVPIIRMSIYFYQKRKETI